ncbi:tyrosine-type recombinase/integrase [candidate division KSB1 bacterium]|nr:tyrosine-type recombinase/integrase [candidate division KSB1 bacterium]
MTRIFKRGKVWYIDIRFTNGDRVRRSLNTTSKKVAELAEKQTAVQIAKEELDLTNFRRISLIEFSRKYLEWYKVENSASSYRDCFNTFKSQILPYFENFYLNEITAEIVETYKIKRAQEVQNGTVNKVLTRLTHLFNKAIQWKYLKENGERFSMWIRRSIVTAYKKAGVDHFSLLDLRHTFASHLVMDGVDLPTVKELMGHSDISTTMIYAHLAPDHLKGAINRLGKRFQKRHKLGTVPEKQEPE